MALGADDAPDVPEPVSVPVGAAETIARPGVPAPSQRTLDEPVWPDASSADVTFDDRGRGFAPAGDSPVRVATAEGKTAESPAEVRVDVVSATDAAAAGAAGVLATVSSTDGTAASTRVGVEVDVSEFAGAFGGDWASRLYLAQFPACALSTPEKPECRTSTPLASSVDPAAGTVTAEVELTAEDAGELASLRGSEPEEGSSATGEGVGSLAVVGVMSAPSGPVGDYQATSLAPSASWNAGGSSGAFSWSYPLRVPPAAGGLEPALGISYSSQSVDGRTSSTNSQASWVGDGFELWPGFIERSYNSCDADGHEDKGDRCWAYDNAMMSLNGSATELIRDDDSGVWRPKNDDGSRVELLTNTGFGNGDNNGEYWRVTTTDGTQYWFGRHKLPGWASGDPVTNSVLTVPVFGDDTGEPCKAATFAASWCDQGYRWNLDYVVDPHGNAMSYFYTRETNYYGRNGVSTDETDYHRGAYLSRIEYGQRADTLFDVSAPGRVVFATAERCIPGGGFDCDPADFEDEGSHWPDSPADLNCGSSGGCDTFSPTFWSRKRLTEITTQVWNGSSYRDVDQWELQHDFPEAGDGLTPALWLDSIQHTGKAGSTEVSLPEVSFLSVQLPNRVEGYDALPDVLRRRVAAVHSETGGDLSIEYAPTECDKDNLPDEATNTMRCFPQTWYPVGVGEQDDWFHKHVVSRVVAIDTTGGSAWMETRYEYLDGAAWHYDDDDGLTPEDEKTWSQWRGYGRVRTIAGDDPDTPTQSEQRFFRGMHGDRTAAGGTKTVNVTDSEGNTFTDKDQFAGMLLETVTYDGVGGPVVSAQVNEPWTSTATATRDREWGTVSAFHTGVGETTTRTKLEAGGWRRTRSTTTFESTYGLPVKVDDAGDTSITSDDVCTRTTYADPNTSAHLVVFVARAETVSVKCATTPSRPDEVVSDSRVFYDGGAHGAAPTKGSPTTTQRVIDYNGAQPVYQTVSTSTYDSLGRVTVDTNSEGASITTTYTPSGGGVLNKAVATTPDPDGAGPLKAHVTTTTLDPAWGVPIEKSDPNGRLTSLEYDAMGRLIGVWLPDRSKAGNQVANMRFDYAISDAAPSVVTTMTLQNDSTYQESYALYDGFLRPRQTQAASPVGSGRLLTDTYHDSLGRVFKANNAYWNSGSPSGTLAVVSDDDVDGQTVTEFDGAGRPVAEVFLIHRDEQWRTTTAYGGDRIYTDPADGGTPSTVINDARGRTTELIQYESGTPGVGTALTTTYDYDHADQLMTVTDPVGNQWSYGYDLAGRQVTSTDPDAGTTTSTYTALDQLATVTDGRGETLAYVYDALGRKIQLRDDSISGALRAQWEYDLGTKRKGVLARSTRYDELGSFVVTNNVVDALYRPTRQTWTVPAGAGEVAGSYQHNYSYNIDGTLAAGSSPAAGGLPGESIAYGYNEVGMPTTVTGLDTYVTDTLYSGIGQPQRVDLHTGGTDPKAWINHTWQEGTGRLASTLVTRAGVTGPDADIAYSYDPAGNLLSIADQPGYGPSDDVQCFDYDPFRRLTAAWTANDLCAGAPSPSVIDTDAAAPYWTSWSFDKIGNRLTETRHHLTGGTNITASYDYPAAGQPQPHAVSDVTTSVPGNPDTVDSYDYDTTGNTIARDLNAETSQSLTWDPEGKLERVTQAGDVSEFVYDADGARILRVSGDEITLYLPGMELHDQEGQVTGTRYYTHNSQTVAMRTSEDGVTFLASDHHGTAEIGITATTGALSQRRHDPYGNSRDVTVVPWYDDHGFLGKPTDTSTGLTQIGARYFDPTIGRFITVDPIMDLSDPQQWHGYGYSNNNPTTWSDPTGLHLGDGYGPYPSTGNAGEPPTPDLLVLRGVSSQLVETDEGVYTIRDLIPGNITGTHDRSDPATLDQMSRAYFEQPYADLEWQQKDQILVDTYWYNNPGAAADAQIDFSEAAGATWNWTKENPGTVTTVAAIGGCLAPAVGWGLCGVFQGAALSVRSGERIVDDGFSADTLKAVAGDTALTIGTGALRYGVSSARFVSNAAFVRNTTATTVWWDDLSRAQLWMIAFTVALPRAVVAAGCYARGNEQAIC